MRNYNIFISNWELEVAWWRHVSSHTLHFKKLWIVWYRVFWLSDNKNLYNKKL